MYVGCSCASPSLQHHFKYNGRHQLDGAISQCNSFAHTLPISNTDLIVMGNTFLCFTRGFQWSFVVEWSTSCWTGYYLCMPFGARRVRCATDTSSFRIDSFFSDLAVSSGVRTWVPVVSGIGGLVVGLLLGLVGAIWFLVYRRRDSRRGRPEGLHRKSSSMSITTPVLRSQHLEPYSDNSPAPGHQHR